MSEGDKKKKSSGKKEKSGKQEAAAAGSAAAAAAAAGGAASVNFEKEPPQFIAERLQVLEKFLKDGPKLPPIPEKPIKVTLPDGSVREGVSGKTTPFEIALSISKGLAENSVVAKVNDELWDLHRPFEGDAKLELVRFDSADGKYVFWHSTAHVLGEALEQLYHCRLCAGPPVEEGLYYDSFMGDKKVVPDDFDGVTEAVSRIVKEKQPFERIMVPKEVALEMFKYNKYKLHYLTEKVPDGTWTSVYKCGPFLDPCRGPHVPHTGRISAFKLTKNSSSYWLGKAENDVLQRVYAVSFPDKKQLKEYEERIKQAAERDHRNIGQKQELFFFHPYSPGCAFFLPHGARIYNKLMDLIRGEYRKRGFTEVVTPNMFSTHLWKTSGHWQNYKENMFAVEIEGQEHALKPMNCPGHCLMFGHRMRTHKELPLRLADFGVLHRNEFSGALTGLTRVRRFQQDDAHIFCMASQIKQEIKGALEFMSHIYDIFGFTFALELSTRPEKYIGDLEVWDRAEKQMEEVLNEYKQETGSSWKLNPGDGAFYGPKIDIHVSDALGRSFQCATIQLDFQLPQKFDLKYQDDKDELVKPVIIHRAILGSVERMIAILTEHTGGKWPFWVSPRQLLVAPVMPRNNEYAQQVHDRLHAEGFYVDADLSSKDLKVKVKNAQTMQYNYILVVGEKEAASNSVAIRDSHQEEEKQKQVEVKSLDEAIAMFKELAKPAKAPRAPAAAAAPQH